jgi:hypothetical protein
MWSPSGGETATRKSLGASWGERVAGDPTENCAMLIDRLARSIAEITGR